MDIQVGDRVTYKNLEGNIVSTLIHNNVDVKTIKEVIGKRKILKIERPKYEIVEETKELLTKKEKQFLQQYIKIIENLNNGEATSIHRSETGITLYLKTGLSYQIEIGTKFSNMQQNITYSLKELGLEENEYKVEE